MNSLKLYGKRDIRFEQGEKPVLTSENDVIVKVMAAGVCGSDISRYKKLGPYVPGMIWGHEFSGQVVEVGGSVDSLKVGDRVAGCPVVFEGEDYFYKKGEYSRSDFNAAIGAKRPGAFAQYICLPSQNFVKIPDTISYESAALVEPSSVVLHGYYRTSLTVGDDVLVVGAGGTIGLLAVQWAKVFGARKVIAVDIDDRKLDIASRVGADATINSVHEDVIEKVAEYTDGLNADIVVEAAGTPITASQVFAYAKKGGGVVFLGIPYSDINIERFYFEKILRSELTVWGSWSCVSAPFPGKEWETSLHFLNNQRISTDEMITHRLDLREGPEIFEKLMEREELIGKVMFFPNHEA